MLQLGLYGPLTSPQAESLEKIQASAQRLLDLITDVLEFAQAESSLSPSEVDLVEVTELGRGCLKATQASAEKKNLQLTLQHDDDVGVVYTSGRRLRRMLGHLSVGQCREVHASRRCGRPDHYAGGKFHRRDAARDSLYGMGYGNWRSPVNQERIFPMKSANRSSKCEMLIAFEASTE
jgi:hypothetical protein